MRKWRDLDGFVIGSYVQTVILIVAGDKIKECVNLFKFAVEY